MPLNRRDWLNASVATAAGLVATHHNQFASAEEPPPQASPSNQPVAQAPLVAPVRFIVGPSTHPPATHEVVAGARLLADMLAKTSNRPAIDADIVEGWPVGTPDPESVKTLVFIGDDFPPERLPQREIIREELTALMARGCGIVCIHYATGLTEADVGPNGEHPLLDWMGGYFATRCKHHASIARVFDAATIIPTSHDHPVTRGGSPFTLHDEPYIFNYFGPNGLQPNVTPLATSQLPPENPTEQIVAWAIQRPDGGRGVGIVMPHFYRSWTQNSLRMLVINAIAWTAHEEIPANGIHTPIPDLWAYQPRAVDPLARERAKRNG